jgi:hypothetical protein
MLCSRGGRDLKRYEGESVGNKSFSHPSEKILLFLKRKPRLLHYSNEWKKSPAWQLLLNHENPRHGRPLATGGKTWALQIAGTEWGSGSGDLRGFQTAKKLSPYPAASLGTSRQSSFRERTALIYSFWQINKCIDEFRS